MVKRNKNPEEVHGFGDAAKGIWARTDAKKAEGKRLAEANRAHIEKMVASGRYGASVPTLNMIKALKMHSWQNTVADWQRLFEAEMIVKLARAKKRKPSPSQLRAMGQEVAREYVRRHGHPNEDQHRRNPGRAAPAPDEAAAHELVLYITNDAQLYRQQTQPIIQNIRRKLKSGKFDKSKVYKLWMYLADNGSRKYTKEFGSAGDRNLFDVPTRWAAAKELHEHYQEEIGEVEGRRSNPASTKGWLSNSWIIVRASDKMVFCRQGSRNVWVKKQFESSGVRGVPIPWNYASNKSVVKAHDRFARRGHIRPSDGKIWFMTWNDYTGYAQNRWKDARGYDVTSIIG